MWERELEVMGEKVCVSYVLSSVNIKWTTLAFNPGRRGENPDFDSQSYGCAQMRILR